MGSNKRYMESNRKSNKISNKVKRNLTSYSEQLERHLDNFDIYYDIDNDDTPFNTDQGIFSKISSFSRLLHSKLKLTPDTVEYTFNDIYNYFKNDWDIIETYKTIEILINENEIGSRL